MPELEANRRPIASRSAGWAKAAAAFLARTRVTPNQISMVSVVFAAIGAALLALKPDAIGLLGCAIAVQARLICNLLDGMVAIEGGKKSPVGSIFNEFPDRIADSLFIVALGYAVGWPALGWFGALAAALTAYIRVFGGSAKQQRMAILTTGCVIGAAEWLFTGTHYVLIAVAVIIAAGSVVTCITRTLAIAARLKES
jgi:CDP-diacylglycerol--glycerol-3-phosphate 3-phosphatidyltransferase